MIRLYCGKARNHCEVAITDQCSPLNMRNGHLRTIRFGAALYSLLRRRWTLTTVSTVAFATVVAALVWPVETLAFVPPLKPTELTIAVDRNGAIYWNGHKISCLEYHTRIRALLKNSREKPEYKMLPCFTDLPLLPDDTFGTPPPASIRDWTRISVLGVRYHPFLILWISPQTFPRQYFERLIVLSPAKYQAVVHLGQSYHCIDLRIASRQTESTLWVSHYAAPGGEQRCVLPPSAKCEFVYKFSRLPGVYDSTAYKKEARDFAENIGCSLNKMK